MSMVILEQVNRDSKYNLKRSDWLNEIALGLEIIINFLTIARDSLRNELETKHQHSNLKIKFKFKYQITIMTPFLTLSQR